MSEINENCLIIKTPYLEVKEDKTYLSAEIIENDNKYVMFFAVANEFSSSLTFEVADCFLVAVLTHAMINNLHVISEAPISRHLLYSLKTRLIPELSKYTKRYNKIEISAQPSDVIFNNNDSVGMGWSGGVDCLYTFIKTYDAQEFTFRLTHLVNINAGVFEGSLENIQKEFKLNSQSTKLFAEKQNLKSLDIDTNIHLLYDEFYLSVGPQRLCSAILSLQKLFSHYYISSAYEVTKLSFDEENSFYYEYTLCSCFSTQNLKFYDIGSEITRIEKLNYISDYPIAQNNLHVCVKSSVGNCTRCVKCVRTLAALYALGKLDKFSGSFDMEKVNKELDEIIGDAYYHRNSQHYKEALDLMEKKGIKISPKSFAYANFLEKAKMFAEKHKNVLLNNTNDKN